jgi:hypothetical protein
MARRGQFELAGGHHLVAGLQALAHHHPAIAPFAGLHGALFGNQLRLAVGTGHRLPPRSSSG